MKIVFLLCGSVFGLLLSRARATDYDAIVAMFRLSDLHLMGVIGVAIGVAGVGLYLLRRSGIKALPGCDIGVRPKPYHKWVFVGGLVFGAGWALTGACPGTSLAQIGEGKLYALFTVGGILAGTYAFGLVQRGLRTAPAAPEAASKAASKAA